ncbi:PadR family transcriptional regulator [Nonomuraea sp. NN258]|uniref:PadR family transcriptional regulator n=1 Tax=Nonomuraea antri TaxID=2730852 RepID=UPI001569A769|nr:PadR family transcriptional regulator [Nonomuraea antri]NRQ34349.1 PadR family transcriptional regulator [Nonomuraea antri]
MTPPRLPATSWAVLGILSFEAELSGYEIKRWADNILRFFYWSPAMSQVYSELRRLSEVGYVSSRQLDGARVYTITPSGREALAGWVRDSPVEAPVLKHGVALRVWLGHLADPESLRAIVAEHRDRAERLRAAAAHSAEAAAGRPGWNYAALVARWSERYHAAERDLAEQMLTDLSDYPQGINPSGGGHDR